jgi:hypothetical protein
MSDVLFSTDDAQLYHFQVRGAFPDKTIEGTFSGQSYSTIIPETPVVSSITVSGKVYEGLTPAYKRILLLRNRSYQFMGATFSNPTTGYYEFTNIPPPDDYIVIAEEPGDTTGLVVHNINEQSNLSFSAQTAFDPEDFAGTGVIYGNVTDPDGAPMERRVALVESLTYILVATTISNPSTGYYEFTDLSTSKIFSVVGEDDTPYSYNDVIRAKVEPETPP